LGDGNNYFFHKSVKVRNSYNLVRMIKDEEGKRVEDMLRIKEVAIGFYQKLLGEPAHEFNQGKAGLVSHLIKKKKFLPNVLLV